MFAKRAQTLEDMFQTLQDRTTNLDSSEFKQDQRMFLTTKIINFIWPILGWVIHNVPIWRQGKFGKPKFNGAFLWIHVSQTETVLQICMPYHMVPGTYQPMHAHIL